MEKPHLGRSGPLVRNKVRIHVLDPLLDSRWDGFVRGHPNTSVFHDRGWLEALARTYGYELYVLTSAPFGQPLENGIVVCRVSSWITGAPGVSAIFRSLRAPTPRNRRVRRFHPLDARCMRPAKLEVRGASASIRVISGREWPAAQSFLLVP